MDMDKKINQLGCVNGYLPLKKISELTQGEKYLINKIKIVKTKFGTKAVVELNNEFTTFLPARFGKALAEDQNQLDEWLEVAKNQRYLHFIGGKFNDCKFITEDSKE